MRLSAVLNHIRRWVAETISLLVINTFVFYLEVGLEPPKKEQKPKGKGFWKKSSLQVRARPVKRAKQGRDEKTQELNPTTKWWHPPLWPPTQCTCIPSSLCLLSELGMQVHCVGDQRRGHHHSVVGLCSWVFSSLPCFVLFTGPALTCNEVFFSETFFP